MNRRTFGKRLAGMLGAVLFGKAVPVEAKPVVSSDWAELKSVSFVVDKPIALNTFHEIGYACRNMPRQDEIVFTSRQHRREVLKEMGLYSPEGAYTEAPPELQRFTEDLPVPEGVLLDEYTDWSDKQEDWPGWPTSKDKS